jgi:hypothetical protein
MRKFLIALVMGASTSALAADLVIDDILGTWCVDNGNKNVFTRTGMTVVFPNGSEKIWKIEKFGSENNQFEVWWTNESARAAGSKGDSTRYELSDNKRTLVQLPQVDGDKGPRMELRRC